MLVKGIVHFEIKMWYLSVYPKGIQDVGVFFSSVDPILMFLGQTVLVCQSYNADLPTLEFFFEYHLCDGNGVGGGGGGGGGGAYIICSIYHM